MVIKHLQCYNFIIRNIICAGASGYLKDVFFLGSVNAAWRLDSAFSNRMDELLYIPMPGPKTLADVFLDSLHKFRENKVFISEKEKRILVQVLSNKTYCIREVMKVKLINIPMLVIRTT